MGSGSVWRNKQRKNQKKSGEVQNKQPETGRNGGKLTKEKVER